MSHPREIEGGRYDLESWTPIVYNARIELDGQEPEATRRLWSPR